MEVSKKRTKKMADPAGELTEKKGLLTGPDIFSISLVTDCIFNHLEYSDLLLISLVSKSWTELARDYLRRQRTSLLKCKINIYHENSLQQLEDHVSRLSDRDSNLRQVFSGVHILIEHMFDEFDVEEPKDWMPPMRAQLTNIFGMFPMKHLIVTFKDYDYHDAPVIYFALEFILPLLPENQLETLEITGVELKRSAEFIWKSLPIKGSPKLKTVQMCGRDYELPLETELLVGDRRRSAFSNQLYNEVECRQNEERKMIIVMKETVELVQFMVEKQNKPEFKAELDSRLEHLRSKVQDIPDLPPKLKLKFKYIFNVELSL